MAKKVKMPTDLNQRAKAIVDLASGEVEPDDESDAVRQGREGGKIGGAERAANLSPERRSEIAKKAAQARWASSAGGTEKR